MMVNMFGRLDYVVTRSVTILTLGLVCPSRSEVVSGDHIQCVGVVFVFDWHLFRRTRVRILSRVGRDIHTRVFFFWPPCVAC